VEKTFAKEERKDWYLEIKLKGRFKKGNEIILGKKDTSSYHIEKRTAFRRGSSQGLTIDTLGGGVLASRGYCGKKRLLKGEGVQIWGEK